MANLYRYSREKKVEKITKMSGFSGIFRKAFQESCNVSRESLKRLDWPEKVIIG